AHRVPAAGRRRGRVHLRHGHDERRAGRQVRRVAALCALLVPGLAQATRPAPSAPAPAATWLGRVRALAVLPALVVRRDAVTAALAELEKAPRPDPEAWKRLAGEARACIEAAPAASQVDH